MLWPFGFFPVSRTQVDGECLPPQAQQPHESLCFLLLAFCLLSVPARFRPRDELFLSLSLSGACSGLELPSAVLPSNRGSVMNVVLVIFDLWAIFRPLFCWRTCHAW